VAHGRAEAMLRAGGYSLLASCGVAAAIVLAAGGFGARDLAAFVAWTLPFGLATGVSAAALAPWLSRAGPARGLVLAGLAAMAVAVLWTIAVGFLLGRLVLPFSFPVFPCWLAGGATGLFSAVGAGSAWRRTAVVAAFVAPLVVFVATAALLALGPRRDDEDIDLVAHFRADASAAEMDTFSRTRLARLDGIDGVSADYGENALYIEFTPGATEAHRDEVVRRLEASPLVVRIERDVAPDEAG
jgi:hypothetical protein